MGRTCKKCYLPIPDGQIECPACGAQNPLSDTVRAEDGKTLTYMPSADDYPMKWFKFVIYFQLFAACVANLLSAFMTYTGISYGEIAKELYEASSTLRTLDTVYAVALVVMAVVALVVRFRLSGFHKDGPVLYLLMLVANVLLPLFYALLLMGVGKIVVEKSSMWGTMVYTFDPANALCSTMGSIIGSCVLIVINSIYFWKRRKLFF